MSHPFYGWRRRTPAEWWSDNWIFIFAALALVLFGVCVALQRSNDEAARRRCEARGGVWLEGTTVWSKNVYVNTPGHCIVGAKEISP